MYSDDVSILRFAYSQEDTPKTLSIVVVGKKSLKMLDAFWRINHGNIYELAFYLLSSRFTIESCVYRQNSHVDNIYIKWENKLLIFIAPNFHDKFISTRNYGGVTSVYLYMKE